jgi:hypothetical protein
MRADPGIARGEAWPALPLAAWRDTYETLHRYTQIVGKVKLALAPMVNHWWQVTFFITPRGLTTGAIPYAATESFAIDFDFIDHELVVSTSRGERRVMALSPRPVAEFYRDVMATLRGLGIEVSVWDLPVEIPGDATPFHEDRRHASYDAEYARRWWRAMMLADAVLKEFRGRFTGKCSPVHFFWGSFDLAVSRFSGRPAPEKPSADAVTREAYCEEVISAGFWPGSDETGGAAFYCYSWPEPPGFSAARVSPAAAYYDRGFSEFLLPYDEVRRAESPRAALLGFLQSTYEAAAELAGWDRARLERPLITPAPRAGEPRGAVLPEQPAGG